MNPFNYKITLRLRHPEMDPDEISAALKTQPRFKGMAGRPRRTPAGQSLDGIYRETYWSSEGTEGSGFNLADTLESLVQELENHKEFLAGFCATGGSLEYFIGWFTNGRNTGATFSWDLQRRLADLRIHLALDVYGGPDRGTAGSEAAPEQ
jgi:hypothetical protein